MNFDDAFQRLIGHEGGYVNDPQDPGGETKYGISKRAFPNEDIAGLTLDRAKALYRLNYWAKAGCDTAPELLKFELFDMAVNQGVRAAVKALQYAAGVEDDGLIGNKTVQAVQAMLPIRLLFRFDAARLVHYAEVHDDQLVRFGRGWLRRVGSNMSAA